MNKATSNELILVTKTFLTLVKRTKEEAIEILSKEAGTNLGLRP